MSATLQHLVIVPIVLPLVAATLMLLFRERHRRFEAIMNIVATVAGVVVAVEILRRVDAGAIGVYLAANWEAPFGIVLVADRLSALMLLLASVISLGSAVYSASAWGRAGVFYYPLFQIQLMGLNGAFLTGDLFNLFVFFEVMLAASYGLHLHGSGWPRVRSGLHYIAMNLVASSLFLIGLAMLYGVVGTLSMADMAAKLPFVPESDRGLLHAGAAIFAVAFLTKAAIWPLNFWLVPAYMATSAPVAALFAVMTKVGIYALLRLSTLLFSASAGPSAHLGAQVFLYGGLVTIAFGALGLMASLRLGRIAAFSILVSSGTLLAAIGVGVASVTAAALYYLVSATLAASALFLLVELVERIGGAHNRVSLPDVELSREDDLHVDEDTNLDDDQLPLVGRVFPVNLALLGLAFIACSVLVAGLPPLSGFVAKLELMRTLTSPEGLAAPNAQPHGGWALFGLLLVSGLIATVSMCRAGMRHFWSALESPPAPLRAVEGAPVIALIFACVWLTARAEPIMRYTSATAEALYAPEGYVSAVTMTKPAPSPSRGTGDEAPEAPEARGEGAP